MASVEDQHVVVYDDDENDEESSPPQNKIVVDEDDDIDIDDEEEDLTSSSPAPVSNHPDDNEVTIAVVGVPASDSLCHEPKQQRINEFGITQASTIVVEEKRSFFLDDSRKLFQRLWIDENEIELLQEFLEYTTQRGDINSLSHHHHDTSAFYNQIKSKLQLDFNKNQLVEKLRSLKKKYRTVMSNMRFDKEFVFKSPHDQAIFQISCKIWNNAGPIVVHSSGPPPPEDGGFNDKDSHL